MWGIGMPFRVKNMRVLGCGNDCVMDEHVGRALDWLLCAIIAALLVLPLEMPTKLKAIWGHIRWALAWLWEKSWPWLKRFGIPTRFRRA